jgi:hypothetical protein
MTKPPSIRMSAIEGTIIIMNNSKILLINPPLLNPFAPYIAMPLLAGTLKRDGWNVQSLDLNIESLDWLLSQKGLLVLRNRLESRLATCQQAERRLIERALTVFPTTVARIDAAKAVLRSFDSLYNHKHFLQAHLILRNALWCISAAFPGLEFDLVDNQLYYDSESSQSILRAVHDADKNVYRWVFERLLPSYLSDPDIALVCISVSANTQSIAAFTVAQLIREIRPDVHVAMCGNYATRIVSRWYEPHPLCILVDSFLTHENEDALSLLCAELLDRRAVSIPGLVRCQDGQLVRSSVQAVNLASLPSPDFDDLPLQKYFAPGPVLPVYASRGCAWKCAFCSIPFPNVGFRLRDASTIVDEMEMLAQRYDTHYFMFVDEVMSIRSLREVSGELIRRKTSLFWFCETRFARGFTSSLASQLYQAGCRRIEFGLESFNQRILNLMHKETDVRDITRNIDDCLRAGISIHLFSILGFPTETKEEALRTIQFIEDTLRSSREEFGIPYSTSGLGPFFLDVHSPIYANPQAFDVEIVPAPPEKDLALNLDYRVKSGIGPEESLRLMENTSRYRPSLPLEEVVWFHTSRTKDVREEAFLRACHNTGVPTELRRPVVVLDRDITQATLKLDDAVTLHHSTSSLCKQASTATPVIVLYQSNSDCVLAFSPLLADWLHTLKTPMMFHEHALAYQNLSGGTNQQARKLLQLLVRFGFLETTSRQYYHYDFDIDQVIFFQEEGTHAVFDEVTNTGKLASSITGKSVEVNLEAFAVWTLCQDGLVRDNSALVELGLLQGQSDMVKQFLCRLIEFGFLYAEPRREAPVLLDVSPASIPT